jgi:hypothetical protein
MLQPPPGAKAELECAAMNARLPAALLLSLFALGCGGGAPPVGPSNAVVESSALGKKRCVVDGDEAKLFLVEWDATDLSSFEAKTARDLVFVRYEGCSLRVLGACADDGVAGRYGSYRAPIQTSGGLEAISVQTEDELYAKLPLGAASFGGELSRGHALELKYFVSGMREATRDQIYRADLAENPRCAGATHFVASYNLGAFDLASVDTLKGGASVGAGSLGAGARHSDRGAALKRGGELASCSSFDQHACRVPIRVRLRRLEDGARPATVAAATAPADPGDALAPAIATMQGVQLRASAEQKLHAGDAQGCLRDLERAGPGDVQSNLVRARCEMRSGKCDEGKRHYREAKAAWARQFDKAGLTNDASLDAEAEQTARQWCPTAAGGGASVQAGAMSRLQAIVQASAAKDGAACVQHGRELAKLVAAGANDPVAKQASAGLQTAAECAAASGRCAEAKELYAAFTKAFFGNADPAFAESAFRGKFPACAAK